MLLCLTNSHLCTCTYGILYIPNRFMLFTEIIQPLKLQLKRLLISHRQYQRCQQNEASISFCFPDFSDTLSFLSFPSFYATAETLISTPGPYVKSQPARTKEQLEARTQLVFKRRLPPILFIEMLINSFAPRTTHALSFPTSQKHKTSCKRSPGKCRPPSTEWVSNLVYVPVKKEVTWE